MGQRIAEWRPTEAPPLFLVGEETGRSLGVGGRGAGSGQLHGPSSDPVCERTAQGRRQGSTDHPNTCPNGTQPRGSPLNHNVVAPVSSAALGPLRGGARRDNVGHAGRCAATRPRRCGAGISMWGVTQHAILRAERVHSQY